MFVADNFVFLVPPYCSLCSSCAEREKGERRTQRKYEEHHAYTGYTEMFKLYKKITKQYTDALKQIHGKLAAGDQPELCSSYHKQKT